MFLNRQYVVDQFSVWQYSPTEDVIEVAEEVDFTDEGLFYFYAGHPVIDGTSNFNLECAKKEEGSSILGCYVDDSIFIYDITDTRLRGIKAVTAAHEMLHVVYSRLSDKDREHVDQLLDEAYGSISSESLEDRMQYYARTEPGHKNNELHSIIATEFIDIPKELSEYYDQYFKDRSSLVKLHDSYSGQFQKRIEKRKDIGVKMEKLSKDIDELSEQYNGGVADLNSRVIGFNNRARDGAFTSQYQFSSERNVLVQRSNELADIRSTINLKIDDYEKLRKQYNKLVDESNNLQKSIDSTLAPPPEGV